MTASVVYLEHVLTPQKRRIEHVAPRSIRSLAPAWQRPFIAVHNGQPLLRADWDRTLHHGETLAFVDVASIPQGGGGGGGGSDPVRMIAMLAVTVMAPGIGNFLVDAGLNAGLYSFGSVAAWSMAGTIAGAAVGLAGMALVNTLLPPPKLPTPQQAASLAAPSPTYSIQAQGNSARLEAAIPEHFGRHIAYPDFAAQPYQEFSGNEQYLYQLLCIGRGEYDLEAIRIEDTPIASFDEITYEVIQPGGTLTLFPANVVTAPEVSGQDLPTGTYIGPFVASAPETQANYIGIDVVLPRGLYYANDNGSLSEVSLIFQTEAQLIDDNGTALGSWVVLGTETIAAATTTPQRQSYRYGVTAGRYQVRVKRTDTEQSDTRYGHDVAWAGLRAYLPDTRTFGDVTLLAMRMRASNNLSMQASRKINVIATRKLPIWNGTSWSAPTATRSIAWAFAYACQQIGLTASQVDLATLLQLDATWMARDDYFDARFDGFLSFWEAVSKIAAAGRAKAFMQGGVMRIMRDQAATIPVQIYSMRNIAKGSLSVDYLMPTADTADSIDVGYFDAEVWAPRRVRSKLPDSTAAKPARVELFGVTSRDHAFREGLKIAAENRYRRKIIKFSTEMEGFIPSFGDLIAIQHDMPAWGQGGEVVAWSAGTLTATLSEPPNWGSGSHYIALRKRDGSVDGPHLVTPGSTAYQVVLANAPATAPYVGGDEERTHYSFGVAEAWRQPARVLAIRPRGLYSVEIEAVNEDASVHTADGGVTTPGAQYSELASYTSAPTLSGLTASSTPGNPSQLQLSWQPSPWADHYLVEQSSDGVTWIRDGDVTGTSYSLIALYGADTLVRVAAVGVARGTWVQVGAGATAAATDAANPPAAPTAVATGVMFGVSLAWGWGDGREDLASTEVWWSATDNRAAATILSHVPYPSQQYTHPGLSAGQGGYYWLRVVDTRGNLSPWYPSSATPGLHATATDDPSDLLTQLDGALGEDQLAATLAERIDLIDVSGVGGVVSGGLVNLVAQQAERIDLIDVAGIGNVTSGGLISLASQQDALLRRLDQYMDTAAEATLAASLKLSSLDRAMTDAGVVTDPDTGEVYIYGVRETERRLSSAEVRLDGTEASINLKASVSYVDQAIATAVIDPAQVAELGAIYARLTAAEVDIDGAEAAIALKANSTTVDGINGRLVTAEGEIDVVQGQVALKAETATVTAIDARLNTAETTLNSIDGASIVQSVSAVKRLARDADQAAEAQLAGLLFADRNIASLSSVIASAKNELYAHTNEGLEAEAGARLTLAAKAETTAAGLVAEQTARSDADTALASSVSTLSAQVNHASTGLPAAHAAIQTEQEARASADTAEASARETLAARVTGTESNIATQATQIADRYTKAETDGAISSVSTTITAAYGAADSTTLASANGHADSAASSAQGAAQAYADAVVATEASARADGDSANATNISTVQARLDTGDFATVKTTATATANALGDVEAKWGVQVQAMADGVNAVAGLQLLAGTDGESVFAILADKLLVYKPDGSGVPKQIVTLGTVNGVTALGLDGNLIIDGSIAARHLSVESLSVVAPRIGGTLRSATSGARMEVSDNSIRVYDSANTLRVLIGYLG
jgi:hypothetical protein